MDHEQAVLLELVLIIALGGGAQWLAWQVRLPSILLLLLFGFIAGPIARAALPDGSLALDPDHLLGDLLLPLVSLSVGVILFEGGLTLNFREVRDTGHVVRNLVTVGALATWIVAAAAAWWLAALPWRIAVLTGAVLIVTGPTVILPLLRHIRPSGRVGSILKWEGIVIDPVGALVTVLTFEILLAGHAAEAPMFFLIAVLKTVFVGGGLGLVAAGVLVLALHRYWMPEFLHNAVTLFLVACVFAVSNLVQAEAGLFAVTLMGIALANQRWVNVRHIHEFKENLRVFLISALFIILAARLKLDDLQTLGPTGVAFVAILILIGRPLSVWISTLGSGLRWQERVFMSWMAPRGIVAAAVASVFAIQLEQAGIAEGRLLVPLTFATIVGTVLVYGTTASFVGQRLGLAEPTPQGVLIVGAHRLAREIAEVLKQHKLRVLLVDTNRSEIAAAKMADLSTYYGSILGRDALDEIDLGGIGRLLALTPNDEVNVLSVQRFVPIFGRAGAYQLPPRDPDDRRSSTDRGLHGRWLFNRDANSPHLWKQLHTGAIIKSTKLSEEFDYDAFKEYYGPDSIPLFVISETGRVSIRAADDTTTPKPGQTVVALVREPPESNDSAES